MENYRDVPPESYKDLTSNGILKYFEDERTTAEEITWIQEVLTSEEYKSNNPISKWNWSKIKNSFAKEFFPNIIFIDRKKSVTVEERVQNLLNKIKTSLTYL